jgi:branched-chain amino acid transport system substrate-binding protein
MFRRLTGALAAVATIMLVASAAAVAEAPSGPPITIGFSMPLTGGLAVNGTSGLLAMQIWAEDTNAKGGLLGRPVKLVYYDDQTNPSLVPGIYTKLLDVDKVDLVVSAYGTNVTAPALPVVIQHNKTFIGLFAMDVNEEFRYPKYFSMLPVGPDPRAAISEGFFEIVKAQKEKLGLRTIALAVDDGEATRNTADGARQFEKGRARCRLRQDLPTDDDRFHADHPCDPGQEPRHRLSRVIPA